MWKKILNFVSPFMKKETVEKVTEKLSQAEIKKDEYLDGVISNLEKQKEALDKRFEKHTKKPIERKRPKSFDLLTEDDDITPYQDTTNVVAKKGKGQIVIMEQDPDTKIYRMKK